MIEQQRVHSTIDLSKEAEAEVEEGNEEANEKEAETKPTPTGDIIDIESAVNQVQDKEKLQTIFDIYSLIREGATSFLWAEYRYLAIYIAVFSIVIFGAISYGTEKIKYGLFAAIAFFIGAITSIIAGYIGMLCLSELSYLMLFIIHSYLLSFLLSNNSVKNHFILTQHLTKKKKIIRNESCNIFKCKNSN